MEIGVLSSIRPPYSILHTTVYGVLRTSKHLASCLCLEIKFGRVMGWVEEIEVEAEVEVSLYSRPPNRAGRRHRRDYLRAENCSGL